MSACADKELLLHGLLDGELDAANTLSCEAHLQECAGCAAEFARLQALRSRLRTPGVSYAAPDALRARISAALAGVAARDVGEQPPSVATPTQHARPTSSPYGVVGATDSGRTADVVDVNAPHSGGSRHRPRRWLAWGWGGSVAALAASLAFVLFFHLPQRGLSDELVASHVRSLLVAHLVDVQTSDRHVVKPWFAGKVDFSPPVLELADQGFPLVGGRLDYIHERVVAAIVYKRRQHIINVFVWPSAAREIPPAQSRHDGYNVLGWSQRGLEFRAVSDVDAADLRQLQLAFSAQAAQ